MSNIEGEGGGPIDPPPPPPRLRVTILSSRLLGLIFFQANICDFLRCEKKLHRISLISILYCSFIYEFLSYIVFHSNTGTRAYVSSSP